MVRSPVTSLGGIESSLAQRHQREPLPNSRGVSVVELLPRSMRRLRCMITLRLFILNGDLLSGFDGQAGGVL